MENEYLGIKGLGVFESKIHYDERGYFYEAFREDQYNPYQTYTFVQDNVSYSKAGVIRGLHYQLGSPQGKLVRVLCGRIYDVALDIRKSSPTFGQWRGIYLDEFCGKSFWISPGFAHGFISLSDDTVVYYKCTDYYSVKDERTIRYDDKELQIPWKDISWIKPILSISEKDSKGKLFSEAEYFE